MDSVARKAIPNIKGMLVYDTTYNSYYFNNGATWQKLGSSASSGLTAGINIGDMLYWDGAQWNIVPAGKSGQFLQFDSTRQPTWAGDQFATITTLPATNITDSSVALGIDLINSGSAVSGNLTSGVLLGLSSNLLLSGNNVVNLIAGTGIDTTAGLYYLPLPSLSTNSIVDGRFINKYNLLCESLCY